MIRPGNISLVPTQDDSDLRVLDTRFRGSHWLVLVSTGNADKAPLRVHMADASAFEEGAAVQVSIDPAGAFLFKATN